MPRNGSGIYTLPALNPVIPFTTITTNWANNTMDDIAAALTGSIASNGTTAITANLQMNGFRHTGVGPATVYNQYARADQVQENGFSTLTSVTSISDANLTQYRGNLVFGQPNGGRPFIAGQMISFTPNVTNSGAVATTLRINGTDVKIIKSATGDALVAGSITGGNPIVLVFDGSDWRLVGGVGTESEIIAALGYTPLKNTTDTFTGTLSMAGAATLIAQLVQVERVLAGRVDYLSTGFAGSGAVNIDMEGRQVLGTTMTGNITMTLSNATNDGTVVRLYFTDTNTGVVTWPVEVVWPDLGTPPVLSAGVLNLAEVTFTVFGAFVLGAWNVY